MSFSGSTSGKELTCQCRAYEIWVQSLDWEDPLKNDMASRFSSLAWRILWTEDLEGYSPEGRKESDMTELTYPAHMHAKWNVWYLAHCHLQYRASQVVLVVKSLPGNVEDRRDMGLIPGSGRSPGEGHGNLLQYSCLENPVDRGAW